MKISYWVEFQANSSLTSVVSHFPEIRPMAEGVFRVYEETQEDSPPWCRIDDLLDRWENLQTAWADQHLAPEQVTVWMRYESPDEELELDIDPLTLYRLGELGLNFCVQGLHVRDQIESIKWLPCQIIGCWSKRYPQAGLLTHQVEVWLNDHSLWQGLVTTRLHLSNYWLQKRKKPQANYWQPSLLILDHISDQDIEEGIIALLRQGRFEEVFSEVEPGEEIPLKGSGWELKVLYEPNQNNPLISILPRLNTWRAATNLQSPEVLRELLSDLKPLQASLQAHGVLRRDLTLIWHHPYRDQVQLEFTPELMLSIGEKGHYLALNLFPQADRIARYWED